MMGREHRLRADYLLIVAHSGRALAKAARKLGFLPIVVDCYADVDTGYYAEILVRTRTLSLTDVSAALARVFTTHPNVSYAVYGSGFEYFPESLELLQRHFCILGNSAESFTRVLNKREFFVNLFELQIPYPTTRFTIPKLNEGWLIKPLHGQGGIGIKYYQNEKIAENTIYWQQYQIGVARSVLFLADGHTVVNIGFNTQWTHKIDGQEYIFAGIINTGGDLSLSQKQQINEWLTQLTRIYSLQGLNTLDFIHHGPDIFVLELNPRISASMQLYGDSLLQSHIDACMTKLPDTAYRQFGYTGYQLVYADQDVVIPDDFTWPEQCADIPHAGVKCRRGQPICSMIARDKKTAQVLSQLNALQNLILNQLIQENACTTKLASINNLNA